MRNVNPLRELKFLHIVLGAACNQHCKMCFQSDKQSLIDPEIFRQKLRPLYPFLTSVCIQGGEPTILPSTGEFINIALAMNPFIRFGIVTNGRLFDSRWSDIFVRYGDFVNISLNAASKKIYSDITINGDWEKVISNLQELSNKRRKAKSKLKVWASFVVLDDNLHEMQAFLTLCRKIGVDKARFFHDWKLLPSNGILLAEQLRKAYKLKSSGAIEIEGLESLEALVLRKPFSGLAYCTRPLNQIFIDYFGNVSFCCLLGERGILGNLHSESLSGLWNSRKALEIRRRIRSKDFSLCGTYCKPRGTFDKKTFSLACDGHTLIDLPIQ